MIVIKLGGSLANGNHLKACLDKVAQIEQGKAVVIVPGGGVFADQVRSAQRQWHFDDRTAHQMALLAMQQMALFFKALQPDLPLFNSVNAFRQRTTQAGAAIWSPDISELDAAGIASTWDITSDSLSAWIAKTLDAEELILVKSVTMKEGLTIDQLVREQRVDAAFCQFNHDISFKLNIINAETFLS